MNKEIIIKWDSDRCSGCFACSVICMDENDAEGKGEYSDFSRCAEKVKNGQVPTCVQICPTNALSFSSSADSSDN